MMKIIIEVEDQRVLDIISRVLELLAADDDETKKEKRKEALDLCKAFKSQYPLGKMQKDLKQSQDELEYINGPGLKEFQGENI